MKQIEDHDLLDQRIFVLRANGYLEKVYAQPVEIEEDRDFCRLMDLHWMLKVQNVITVQAIMRFDGSGMGNEDEDGDGKEDFQDCNDHEDGGANLR